MLSLLDVHLVVTPPSPSLASWPLWSRSQHLCGLSDPLGCSALPLVPVSACPAPLGSWTPQSLIQHLSRPLNPLGCTALSLSSWIPWSPSQYIQPLSGLLDALLPHTPSPSLSRLSPSLYVQPLPGLSAPLGHPLAPLWVLRPSAPRPQAAPFSLSPTLSY